MKLATKLATKLTTKQMLAQIKDFWKSQNKKNKKIMIIGVSLIILFAVIMAVIFNFNGYATLYSGLSSSEMGQIASELTELGVDFKTRTDGTIQVPKDAVASLQITLAAEGYPQSTLTYDIFSSNSGFMTTDYEKQKYLLFQLQNRLQNAIKTIKGIKNAIVTISMPEEDSFVLQADKIPTTASVVLDLEPTADLSAKQISGIESLVSKSVPGLKNENVAIVSDTGEMLNNQHADGGSGNTYSKLELEKNISDTISNKLIALLTPIFGDGNVRVAVNTTVDINKTISEQITYSPVTENSGIVATQDSAKQGSGSGTAGGVPGSGSNTSIPTYTQTGNGENNGNYSESSSVRYFNNQLVEQIEREAYEIKDLTVAVLVGNHQLSAADTTAYKEMIAFAAGITPEKVAITKADFATAETNAAEATAGLLALLKNPYLLSAAAAVSLILIAIVLLLKKKKKKRLGTDEKEFLQNELEAKEKKLLMNEEIILNETKEQSMKKQIKDFSAGSPDIVAQLIRTWIKEDYDNNEY